MRCRRQLETAAENFARKQRIMDELKAIAHDFMVEGANAMNAGRIAEGHELLSFGVRLGKHRLDLLQAIADGERRRHEDRHGA